MACCAWEVRAGDDVPDRPLPIGRPIWNTRLYVLDEQGALVPPGVPGELYIGGAGVAAGYVNRAALTAERFVPDPYGPSGARLYRSGDLVVHRRDGVLVYLGRIDDQVKVLGHRIELGEVDAASTAHVDVAEAACVVDDRDPLRPSLVAFVVLRRGSSSSAAALEGWLASRLPAYMVPTAVVVPALPLNGNGKVDRPALARALPPVSGTAPAPPAEAAAASTFARAAGVPVAVDDDVFRAGCTDLAAAAALHVLATEHGLRFTLAQLHHARTPRALVASGRAGSSALATSASRPSPPRRARRRPPSRRRRAGDRRASTAHRRRRRRVRRRRPRRRLGPATRGQAVTGRLADGLDPAPPRRRAPARRGEVVETGAEAATQDVAGQARGRPLDVHADHGRLGHHRDHGERARVAQADVDGRRRHRWLPVRGMAAVRARALGTLVDAVPAEDVAQRRVRRGEVALGSGEAEPASACPILGVQPRHEVVQRRLVAARLDPPDVDGPDVRWLECGQ